MPIIRQLVSSGWWVALAGIAVALSILILAIRTPTDGKDNILGDGRNPKTYGFDLSTSLVPVDQLTAAGLPRDGLMALTNPRTLTPGEIEILNQEGRGKFLLPSDRIVGVAVDGIARAYPLRFMRWHEVVNDEIGGRPVLVSYNPLCDSAVVTDRNVDGEILEFGFSGLVMNSNLLMFDRREDPTASSLWSQIDARAVVGPAATAEASLALLPSALTTWGTWLENHPSTQVLAPLERLKRVYKRDPYHSYFGSDVLRFPVDPLPPESDLRLKDRVLILTMNGHDNVFSLSRIASMENSSSGAWSTEIEDLAITIRYDAIRGTAYVQWPEVGDRRVSSRQAFWFAWYAQHPQTSPPQPGRQ